ncbi:class I SAM-dependent methyltransferase [bacterium]|nr:class I SAM-dependent methyltransferase [bacterium]
MQKSRDYVIQYIKQKKQHNKQFRVIDIGGGVNPWAGEVVDAYIDICNPKNSKNVFIGDINETDVWDQILKSEQKFDFSICTHTLEDIRDPIFVLKQIMKISKSGYISFPSKHTEFSNHESHYWNGSCHHRWVFTVKSDAKGDFLFFMPLWPCVSYFNSYFVNPWLTLKRFLRLTNKDKFLGSRRLPWLNSSLASSQNELGFIWDEKIRFEYLDFAHPDKKFTDQYKFLLADGL